ncbi:MAG: IPT/TIG domain-containing protein [Solirubrobacteraceae bacterium]|nr:IPT/TIG domain-containing protein [Solirubrobacteraceae bacterium]
MHVLVAFLVLVGACALVASSAEAATKKTTTTKKKAKKKTTSVFPTVTKVTPARARVGETLTIRGKNFLVGKNKTTVVFRRDGKKAIFVKASISTKTMLKVAVPATLETQLATKDGYPLFTKFRLRIGAKRFGKKYIANMLSVGPVAQPGVDVDQCARVRTGGDPNGDLDADFLTNSEELRLVNPLNPCAADTDGDGLGDGWEFFSAQDLNQRALPYPGKRPWPNPLDPDSLSDYDGDGLTATQEFKLWNSFGRPYQTMENRDQLLYSDGTQASSGPGPDQRADLATLQANAGACAVTVVPPNLGYLGNGYVDATVPVEDDEKDADHDGLSNWAEFNGYLTQKWWKDVYATEVEYTLRKFADLDPVDNDGDGDGCLDGLDDQDADDWPNWTEHGDHYGTWRDASTQWGGFTHAGLGDWNGWADAGNSGVPPYAVNPFNPCLPEATSRTCSKYRPAKDKWPPFSDPYEIEGCTISIPYLGRATTVWVWDRAEKLPWPKASCPP